MKCGKGISAGASRRGGNDRQVEGNVPRLRRSLILDLGPSAYALG